MQERRLTSRLTEYWENIRKGNPLPEIAWFNTSAMEDVWPWCLRLAVQPGQGGAKTYKYEHTGEKLREAYGADMTGQLANSKSRQFPGAKLLAQADALLAEAKPMIEQGQFVNEKHKVVKYRACLLPFGKEGGVTHIIVGVSWKAF